MTRGSVLQGAVDATAELLTGLASAPGPKPQIEEIGTVVEVGTGVAIITGLEHALADELVIFAISMVRRSPKWINRRPMLLSVELS